ncbi:T9SS sorting signal type C domain-containing protein [Winogradskyella sp. MH6]|uniref:T9SS sorting signal type C domain-containing protein n=1 Tax=Winogradskyella sp. MH6 TaxID=2929510 RepID=UPI001FB25792|nr:T9SS sorting signal type C domain-containing protein [Winogradskyella sp. MH6]
MKKFLLALIIIFLGFTTNVMGQCASFGTDQCTTPAPTVVGNSIYCNPPLNNAGRNNFRVTNMIANATYRVSNCGSGVDTQMTIRTVAGASVAYNDDNGPACTGTAASIDFVPPSTGDYRIQVNEYNCATTPSFNETGDITVTLIADPPPPLSNDECIDAIPLTTTSTCSYTAYSNSGASSSSGVPSPGCASYSGGDIWFSVVVNASGEITIDTQSSGITDSGMALYSGSCANLTLIECDDDDSDNGLMSMITLTGRTPGETIYIRFWEYGNDNQGAFGICATSPIPPDVYGVALDCPGDASQPLTSTYSCQGLLSIGNTINGNLNAATDSVALQPEIFISSIDPCSFDTTDTSNYTSVDFTVDTTGTYVFAMETPVPYFDAMGYIYETASGFVPGACSAGYIAGDDDDGPDLDPQITANLVAGTTYTLVTTKFSFSSTTHTGPFTWTVTGPAGDIDWYTTAVGGTPIGSGSSFDPVGVVGSPLTDTNTPGVYSFWGACPSDPSIRYQADYIIGKLWNGTLGNTDWNIDTNWLPIGVPMNTNCIIIPDTGGYDPIIDGTTDGNGLNLTIENGATLTQQSNSTLTIVNFIDVQTGGTYDMEDSASLIQVDDVANTVDGTFTMDRDTNIRVNDYVYWSSPVTSFDIQNVSPGTPNGYKYEWLPFVNRVPGPPGPLDYGEWQAYNSGPMDIGKGYIVKGPTGHTATPSNFTATFSGTPNNGQITQNIQRSTYTGANYFYNPYGNDLLMVTSDDDNWNLIGNPYPSAIDAIDFLTHTGNGNITGSVYLWTHDTDIAIAPDPFYDDYVYNYDVADYIAYNSSGTSTPTGFNGNIGAGQGFFVLMTDAATTNETVTFDNTMRSSAYANDQFYRTSNPSDMDGSAANRIWLDYVNPSGQSNTTLVAYVDGATNDEDRMFDAPTTTGNGLDLYSLIDEKAYLIQGRQLPFDVNDQVPIGLNISESGIQTIAINTLQGVFYDSNQDIFIEDLLNDTIHNIKESPYSFTSESGIINDRFILRFTNTTLGLDDFDTLNGISVFEDNDKITVKSDYGTIASIDVYDILGRTLYFNKSVNASRFSIESISPYNATLLLKIKLADGKQKIAKIIF